MGEELDSLALVRPRARSSTFDMVADSLEVQAPGEVLERVFAAGRARAVSSDRDSLNTPETPEIIRRDWIEGDTVVAFFRPAERASPDDSTRYVIERLESRVLARSLYRLEPESAGTADSTLVAAGDAGGADSTSLTAGQPDSLTVPDSTLATPPDSVVTLDREGVAEAAEGGPPGPVTETGISPDPRLGVHYVIADEIVIIFVDGEVERMEVKGLDQGLYLDPAARRVPTQGGS